MNMDWTIAIPILIMAYSIGMQVWAFRKYPDPSVPHVLAGTFATFAFGGLLLANNLVDTPTTHEGRIAQGIFVGTMVATIISCTVMKFILWRRYRRGLSVDEPKTKGV
jgi:Na+-translocating ferredoxin:NAD+ oxidoreductase RnfD subunit